ncbi:MAG: molybdate transport system ATP-binding protein [Polaribacter sp.]|jgi:molybdate transport system ATP-binding protein
MIAIDIHKKLSAATGEMLLEVNTQIPSGQLLTLYGKSGAGKTTLLRILAGLTEADKGQITIDGVTWLDTNKKIKLPPQQRNIGFVFQDYALFPNMTVQENLSFALKKEQSSSIIKELIELIELGDLRKQKPKTLSGGQKQRVALARALVQQPKLLLLDEPLSAIDSEMRNKLQTYLLKVQQTYDLTTILVSHDESEIRKMSTAILILDQGKIIQQGKVEDLFPSTKTTLNGQILSMEQRVNNCKIIVEIGRNKVEVMVNSEKAKGLEIGGQMEVEVSIVL